MLARVVIAIVVVGACGPAPTGDVEIDGAPAIDARVRVDGGEVPDETCEEAAAHASYVGCDYWPTVVGNPVADGYHFAVAVANATDRDAHVTVEGGGLAAAESFAVAPGAVVTHLLPWVPALKLCTGATWAACASAEHPNSALARGGAFHLRTDVPVTVYQFNPLEYTLPRVGGRSYSNDASLLLPSTAWGTEHLVVAWHDSGDQVAGSHGHPGLMAVTAAGDAAVTITTTAPTTAEGGAPAFEPGVAQTVALGAGDVLELGTPTGDQLTSDLTGTRVSSDAPVQVIGGHYCATVPEGVLYCDHVEELMLPVAALGARYVINAPAGHEEIVRIVAVEDDTTLAYDPPRPDLPAQLAHAGDVAEIAREPASFALTANRKILVGQLMEGSAASGGEGDPSLAITVPVEQFRRRYVFHAPTHYAANHVDVTAPVGAAITLDGALLGTGTPIGTSGWQVVRVAPLDAGPGGDGGHVIAGDQPFGISVYGYGLDTSYWYAGGLDLAPIVID